MPPDPYGAYAAVDGLGGVASPLLAGFAVTLIALVVQIEERLRWPNAGLAVLALAMVLFLQVVQLNARAKGYAVTPAQAAEWYDDMADPDRRAVVRWELRHHHDAWSALVRRARFRYNVGILALLAGTAGMLVPPAGQPIGAARIAAITVIGVGALIEALDLYAQRWQRSADTRTRAGAAVRRVVALVTPPYPPVPRPPFPGPPETGPGDVQSSSSSSSSS